MGCAKQVGGMMTESLKRHIASRRASRHSKLPISETRMKRYRVRLLRDLREIDSNIPKWNNSYKYDHI